MAWGKKDSMKNGPITGTVFLIVRNINEFDQGSKLDLGMGTD
jgi:hypothetical protein